MNGLALDVTVVAFLFLFLSVSLLWLGSMWEHKDCERLRTRRRTDRGLPSTDRLIWDDESWEFGNDPRDLVELEESIVRRPSNRNC